MAFLSALLALTSCSDPEKKIMGEGAVAKAYNNYLYMEDIQGLHKGMNPADSINVVNNAIDHWLTEQLVSEAARTQLPEKTRLAIQNKVESYANDLYRFAYEKEIIQQKMDTVLSDSAVQGYFDAFIANYLLDEAWLRFIYVRCDKPQFAGEVEAWIKDSIDLYNLEDFCSEELQVCHLYPNRWVSMKKFMEKLAESGVEAEKVRAGDAFIKIKKDNLHYFIRILEFRDKGEAAPLTFVENDIRSILLKKKKSDFLNAFHRELVSRETVKGNVKIFDNGQEGYE